MKYFIALGLVVAGTGSALSADMLSVEVGYGFVGTSSSGIYTASPDTSFVKVWNTGTTTFTGVLSLTGTSGYGSFGHDVVNDFGSVTLAPGDSWVLFGGPEASNFGGFNKCQTWVNGDSNSGQDPTGIADSGMLFSAKGTLGANALDYSIYDHEIHSGTSATSPFGVTLDNYILQGGDPFGRDTFDTFEEAQAHAFFDITGDRRGTPISCPVPEANPPMIMLGFGILAMVANKVRRTVASK